LLLVMALPFLALLNWRGDVRGVDLLLAYAILLVTAAFLAVASLAVSAWSRQSATALVVAYAIVLVVCGGLLCPLPSCSTPPRVIRLRYCTTPARCRPSPRRCRCFSRSRTFGGAGRGMFPIWQVYLPLAGVVR
jgi:hypothetical protein